MSAFFWFHITVLCSTFAQASQNHKDFTHHHHHTHTSARNDSSGSDSVREAVRTAVAQNLGETWVETALKIAQIESRFQCHARNHGALGVFQVAHPERFGISPARALTCEGGIEAGIAHMRHCIALGANDEQSMLRCHNSGSPYGRVSHAYRRFMHHQAQA